jgi:hypothetical protein
VTQARRAAVRPEIGLAFAAVASSFLVYWPFLHDMSTVYRFWDGPNYMTVARDLYRISPENPLLSYVYTPVFFASYLPFYPFCVRLLAFVGYERALPLATLLYGRAVLIFYRLARDVWKLPSPGSLALVFLFLPPRWVLYRSVGASEAVYIACSLASIWFFEKGRIGRASAAGGLAALTRISGLMIAPAYAAVLIREKRYRQLLWLGLIPLGLLGYFVFCAYRFGDFFAYFRAHGEKLVRLVPFGFLPVLFEKGLYHQVEFHIPPGARLRRGDLQTAALPRAVLLLRVRVRAPSHPLDRGLEPLLPLHGAVRADRGVPRAHRHPLLPVGAAGASGTLDLLRVGRPAAEWVPAGHLLAPARAPRPAARGARGALGSQFRREREDATAAAISAAAWRATPARNGPRS